MTTTWNREKNGIWWWIYIYKKGTSFQVPRAIRTHINTWQNLKWTNSDTGKWRKWCVSIMATNAMSFPLGCRCVIYPCVSLTTAFAPCEFIIAPTLTGLYLKISFYLTSTSIYLFLMINQLKCCKKKVFCNEKIRRIFIECLQYDLNLIYFGQITVSQSS